uniref:Uncharacterized protein LOC114342943 n=1 Tax=Diabrotica virgifera virgifera TaxID=50390 RepID=A0A6P7H0I4_DIAVI
MQQRKCVLLNPKANIQIKRDRKKKFTRNSVLKMLAVMEASQSTAGPSNTNQVPAVTPEEQAANAKDFLSSGRTGRRNALADILSKTLFDCFTMTMQLWH